MSKDTRSQKNETVPPSPAPAPAPVTPTLPNGPAQSDPPFLPPPFSERKGNVETGLFVNLDTKETMIYPLHTNERFPDWPTLQKEQWAIRKALAEMMLDRMFSERYKTSRLHRQLTQSIRHDEDSTGRLSWLPSGVLFRVFNELNPLSLLALAVTSFRLLKLTAPHVQDLILPRHIGSWAGNRVQYLHVVVDGSLHFQRKGRTPAYIENYVNYRRWTKGHRIVEPPRSFCFTLGSEGSYETEKIFATIMAQVERYPARLSAIEDFITHLRDGDEFWLSFHQEKKYWFNKIDSPAFDSGEFTAFDLSKWALAAGPGRLDENSLPSSVFRRSMYFLGGDSFFSKSHWAGEPWKVVPCEDNQDDTLELVPLQRAERRQEMLEDILLREEGGRLSKVPRSEDEEEFSYHSNPDSRRKVEVSQQFNKKSIGARALMVLVAICWAVRAGVFPELWYFVTLGWWLFMGKEIEGESSKSYQRLFFAFTMVCLLSDSWETSSSSTTAPPTPPSPQPSSPRPTPNFSAPTARSFPPRIPQWDIQQINPNFTPTSSFSFTSPPKSNPPLEPKQPPTQRSSFNRKPKPSSSRMRMGKSSSEDTKADIDRIHQILSTTLMSQKYAASFHQQQVCTQPSSRTYTFDDADEDGVINIAIDAEQRLKDFMESCNSCDTLGDQMSKIVHGQCIELFRVRCDEGENGERRIQGLELDLRQLKRPEVEQMIGDSQSARMKLLEARMRGTDSSTVTVEEDDVWLDNDEGEGLGSVRLLEGIQSIANKYQDQEGEKRRRLGVDQEVIVRPTAKAGEETNSKGSRDTEKNEDKSRASLLSTKAVLLTQPRNRNSKQGSSVQMKSKKKNKKKNKERKEDNNGIEITRIITPMESITIYDAPTEGDLSLRNPQTAWAQRKGDELTITQSDEQIPTSPHSFPAGNGESDISGLMYHNRLNNEREKYRNLYSVQPLRENPRTNVFILYSTDDEKASPHHRMDIFSKPATENNFPTPMMGSVKPIDPDDVFEENEMPISSLQGISSDREHGDREQPGTLIIPPNSTLTHEDMDNDVATAMEALQLKDGGAGNLDLEATLDVLRRDQERVSAEINRLLEVQEKTRDQDREVDRLLRESSMPSVKYTIMEPGQQFSLSQALDDLIDLGSQNAPNFEPQSPGEQVDGQISSTPLYIPSDGCKLPTQQQKQEWLDSIASSSTSTTSTGGSEFDLGDSISQADTYPRDRHSMISDTSQEPQSFTTAEGSMVPLLTPHLRYSQGFEAEVRPSVSLDDIPTPLAHLGPNVSPKTIRPLFERLGYEFENLNTPITRKGGKKQKIKSGVLKTEWTSDIQDLFESSYPQEKRHADGAERTNLEVSSSDSSVSALSVSDKTQPLPDAKTSVEAHTEPEPEDFKIPTASFTVESDLVIDMEAPKPKVPETPLRLKLPMKTPLKGILKKTSQFTKPTDEGSLAIEPVGADRALDKGCKALKRSEIGRQTIYAKLPFSDVSFNGITNSGKPSKPMTTPREEGKLGPPKLTEEQQYEIAVAKLFELPGFLEKDVNEEEIVENEFENEVTEEGPTKEDTIKNDPMNETVVEEYSEDEDMTLLASDESDEEPDEETEEQKEIKRAIKGKAVDRETWMGLDCRFFELNSSTPFERRRPSSHYPRRPMRLQDDIIFARAIHESLVEAERDFETWKRNELAAQSVNSEQALAEDVSFERESPAASLEGMNNAGTAIDIEEEKPHTSNQTYLERASAAHQPADSIDKNEQLDTRYLSTSAFDDEEDDPFAPAEERARKEAEKAKL
ncbi:hypothetical protein TWF217_002735 [Orbilia oligospora]|nr:hypothetical protein TWF217_002735 [Orbilia oligospora]